MAEYLTGLEQKYRFLERAALNLIVGFSGMDSKKLPPMSDSAFELSSSVKWRKSLVKQNIRNTLMAYIPLLRVVDSLNWQEVDTGDYYADKLYNYGMTIPNNSSIDDFGISFSYLDFWDIYFDLNCNGEVCEPESAFTDLLPIGIQRYNFVYDLSFPVLVEIDDPSAFKDQGYTFNFMLESNIRNNRAMPALFEPLVSVIEEGSMLCDEDKRTSGNIRMEVSDALDGSKVDGVEVIYTCIDSCHIGEVKEGLLETSLPVCLGGALSFRKDDYETNYVMFDAFRGRADSIRVSMNPYKTLSVDVKKKILAKQGSEWVLDGEGDIGESETAIVTLSKYSDEGSYDILEVTKDSEQTVSLSEGTYEIEINLMSDRNFYIPPETREVDDEDVHIQEFNVTSPVIGRIRINYSFSKSEVLRSKLELYVLAADLFEIPLNERTVNDLGITNEFEDYTKKYYIELVPKLE